MFVFCSVNWFGWRPRAFATRCRPPGLLVPAAPTAAPRPRPVSTFRALPRASGCACADGTTPRGHAAPPGLPSVRSSRRSRLPLPFVIGCEMGPRAVRPPLRSDRLLFSAGLLAFDPLDQIARALDAVAGGVDHLAELIGGFAAIARRRIGLWCVLHDSPRSVRHQMRPHGDLAVIGAALPMPCHSGQTLSCVRDITDAAGAKIIGRAMVSPRLPMPPRLERGLGA